MYRFRKYSARCLVLLALGCGASVRAPTASSPSNAPTVGTQTASGRTIDEASVQPRINAPYFQPGALDRYTRILEAESREVVQHRDDILNSMDLAEGMVVADIGAVTGFFTTELAKRVGDTGTVLAVDIVPAFLDRIRERVRAEQLTNVTVVEGEERATGLDPASVDLAFMCDTYHHIEYPQAYMLSLFQTLRHGGTLVLIDFKRIEGTTSPSRLKHVRADEQTVLEEVSAVGFVLEAEINLLEDNYYLRFRRP